MDTFIGLEKTPTFPAKETPDSFNGVCYLSEINKLEHSRLGPVNKITFSHAHHSNDSDEACYREYVNCLCRHRHPNVVSVYRIDVHPSGCCLYAEYPDRGDILSYMKKRVMTWEMLLDVTHDVLKGLISLEKLRRDNQSIDINIQPDNIWMFAPGTAKVAFGAFPWKPNRDGCVCELNKENSHDVYKKRRAHSVNSFGSTLDILINHTRSELASSLSVPCPSILTHLVDVCTEAGVGIIPTFTELLDTFRSQHQLTWYTAWDVSLHNSNVNKAERWIIHKRHVFKRKPFTSRTNNVENRTFIIPRALDSSVDFNGIKCSESLDLETRVSDDENSDCCLRMGLKDDEVSEEVEGVIHANDTHTNLCRGNSSCDLTEDESSCDEIEFNLSALKEACLSDSWDDMTSCNDEDRNGSESYLWDDMLPDIDSRTSSSEEGKINYLSDDSKCCANSETDAMSGDLCENGASTDPLDSDQLDSIDGFVTGGCPSNDHSEYSQNLTCTENKNYRRQTYVGSIGCGENGDSRVISDSFGYNGDVQAGGNTLFAETVVGLSGIDGDTASKHVNSIGRCQGIALLDDISVMFNRDGGCTRSQTLVSGENQREKDAISFGNNFLLIGKCAELSPLNFWGDYRIDILLLLRDIDDKQSDLPQTSSIKDYRKCLIQCLTRIDSRDIKQAKTEPVKQDPNSRVFPVTAQVRLNPFTLRPWLKDWQPFDTSLPNSGFAWEAVHVCEMTLDDPVEKIPWYGREWQPFDMTIEEEVAWETLPNDVIKEDQPTEQQLNVIHYREKRKYFHHDREMSIRRNNLAFYFKEKYNLNWEVINPYLDFVTRLDENEKELQCLAEDDFCFIIR